MSEKRGWRVATTQNEVTGVISVTLTPPEPPGRDERLEDLQKRLDGVLGVQKRLVAGLREMAERSTEPFAANWARDRLEELPTEVLS